MAGYDDSLIAHKGPHGEVRYAVARDGSSPAKEFFDRELDEKGRAAMLVLFKVITSSPELRLMNREQFKQVDRELFEFKRISRQVRMFCFRRGNVWYLTSGITGKKENKLDPRDIAFAQRIMQEHLKQGSRA